MNADENTMYVIRIELADGRQVYHRVEDAVGNILTDAKPYAERFPSYEAALDRVNTFPREMRSLTTIMQFRD